MLVEVTLLCCFCITYLAHADIINMEGCGEYAKDIKAKPGKIFSRQLQPWIVHIYAIFDPRQQNEEGTYGCSGSIISPRFVLTSAHCLTNGTACCGYPTRACTPSLVQVYYNFTVAQTGPYLSAKSIFYHPYLDSEHWVNDVALIMLEEPLHLDEYVRPVCLPNQQKQVIREGALLVSPEWGIMEDEQVYKFLYHSTANVVSFEQCSESIELPKVRDMKWHRFLFCTQSNGKNPMEGLAGGPLTRQSGGKRAVQVGIASYTFCRKDYKSSVQTRVDPYIQWIKEVLSHCARWERRGHAGENPNSDDNFDY